MNDSDREQWVNNDEGLYDLWKRSGQGITTWIRANRNLIDQAVEPVSEGTKKQHHLKYG